jgi:hypothetical protein
MVTCPRFPLLTRRVQSSLSLGFPDEELRLQFEAVTQFSPEDKKTVKSILEGMILKHEARRWSSG